VRSSRAIARRCRDDVAFRVITANHAPDHATIARFGARHQAAIADLFGEMLALCARSGLVKVGVARSGTRSPASRSAGGRRKGQRASRSAQPLQPGESGESDSAPPAPLCRSDRAEAISRHRRFERGHPGEAGIR
jgi:hypothetical protein